MAIFGAVTARMSGGGLGGHKMPHLLPELLFGAMFLFVFGLNLHGLLAMIWAAAWMQTGHAKAYHMGFGFYNLTRKHTLDFVVEPLCKILNIDLGSERYCWLFMGIKGFLITLPIGGFGVLYWPLSYWLGWKFFSKTVTAEYLTGFLVALNVIWKVF